MLIGQQVGAWDTDFKMMKFQYQIIFGEIDSDEIDFVVLILNESAFSDVGSMNVDSCWMTARKGVFHLALVDLALNRPFVSILLYPTMTV